MICEYKRTEEYTNVINSDLEGRKQKIIKKYKTSDEFKELEAEKLKQFFEESVERIHSDRMSKLINRDKYLRRFHDNHRRKTTDKFHTDMMRMMDDWMMRTFANIFVQANLGSTVSFSGSVPPPSLFTVPRRTIPFTEWMNILPLSDWMNMFKPEDPTIDFQFPDWIYDEYDEWSPYEMEIPGIPESLDNVATNMYTRDNLNQHLWGGGPYYAYSAPQNNLLYGPQQAPVPAYPQYGDGVPAIYDGAVEPGLSSFGDRNFELAYNAGDPTSSRITSLIEIMTSTGFAIWDRLTVTITLQECGGSSLLRSMINKYEVVYRNVQVDMNSDAEQRDFMTGYNYVVKVGDFASMGSEPVSNPLLADVWYSFMGTPEFPKWYCDPGSDPVPGFYITSGPNTPCDGVPIMQNFEGDRCAYIWDGERKYAGVTISISDA